jgi:tRNA-specific 2-thiouridylase
MFMVTCDESQAARVKAEAVARRLGIELHVLDLRPEFERVLDYFGSEYRKGRTPNPCVFCNRYIKFGTLWDFVRQNGGDFIATGHYAQVHKQDGRAGLYEARDLVKDQSYVLSMIAGSILPHLLLPMGDYTKDQVRKLAAKFMLGTEQHAESQEICFIPGDDYAAVLEKRCPELVRPGNIVDSSGRVLGHHNGIHRFTIGQRRGLRVAMGKPYYVAGLDADTNTVVLGPREEVMHKTLTASDVNWLLDRPEHPFRAKVKIRYNSKGADAVVAPQGDGVSIHFDQPSLAITPGQLAVF